ncbi:hypothetical protein B296_00025293 [Ensete ventricosum]|uniref:non-specific serine/threonine protein kinase n=1 Tax=Ensete ventricosum TaxID=4639 RepID=A0A426ZL17_ENSVE|nr:hypothetical protein B296_00025293 [Ensete ventricosum]
MGNCCMTVADPEKKKRTKKKEKRPNPFSFDYDRGPVAGLVVLSNPTGRDIGSQYELAQELGRGEFGVTYLCTNKATGRHYACKSISKKKLRNAVDIEDVRREVEIMRHLPSHPNIVSLKDTYEDDGAVHLVMELCEGGELFDRIVARGHYTERAAAAVTRTIIQVIQVSSLHFCLLFLPILVLLLTLVKGNSGLLATVLTFAKAKDHSWLQNAKKAPNVNLGETDGRISYEEFAAMMKAGTDWRKASRQYSRERFSSLSSKLMKDGSLQRKVGAD